MRLYGEILIECAVIWKLNLTIREKFVGISFFVSDFSSAESVNKNIVCFGKYFDFIFLENKKYKVIENLIPTKDAD